MQNNYYFLRILSVQLEEKITGWELLTCFSQNKNELILGFALATREFYLRGVLNPDFTCLTFPDSYARSKKNSVDLFPELIGQKVTKVVQYQNERSFSLQFTGHYTLLFKMYGNRSNIILFRDDEVVHLFKKRMVKDLKLEPEQLDRPLDHSYSAFEQHDFDYKKLFPTFGKEVRQYLEEATGYFMVSSEQKWEILKNTKQELENPQGFYIQNNQSKPVFLIIRFGNIIKEFQDPFQALNEFYIYYTRIYYLDKEKKDILQKLERQRSKTGNYLLNTKKKLEDIEHNSRYEEIANIIMANLLNIPAKAEVVELFDFYHNQNIRVKLKKDLSPQKNAENLYRKAKNKKIEIKNLRQNIYEKQNELEELEKHIQIIDQIDHLKELRNYISQNSLKKEQVTANAVLPFKQFIFDSYEILVGKNAKNNDELTQKYARKNDLWLHAKDVSGSHVVIKQLSGHPFPRHVIERAAQLAAYYSKRKTDTLCPVIYTPKKYVRKPKGGVPGFALIEKEEVILVEPKKWQ
ncbi:MAG: NFACT RNA binding domain-containing protein [Candidatus Cyclobacteriaceae bacterium M3_2C_046]